MAGVFVEGAKSEWIDCWEFHASAKELVGLIQDLVLAKFAIEPGKYSLEQSVALVKRIKAWGRR